MKRLLLIAVAIAALSMMAAPAWAAESHACEHDATTIASLHHCVEHAAGMGHITNRGVANSLLQKLDAAQAASDRGQSDVAVNQLRAFINEVNAQSGKHIEAEHAGHLVMHAEHVIAALGG